MLSDAEIARNAKPQPIAEIASKMGLDGERLDYYGKYKAKINATREKPSGKLVLVTAMSPTPFGEGKTTVSIGLADALVKLGARAVLALREPSLGPVFGIKGGACGGGYAQVIPMEDINLHFTGDFHAITAANNLLSALIDNHIYQGNALGIERVIWKRCMDMNDRALRHITVGVGGGVNGVTRDDGFNITAASEIMAILCLATSLFDLKKRLASIVIGYDGKGSEIKAGQLRAEDAMASLLKDAIKPNLVQTLEGTPAIIHGGPFANIAHGCNSVLATSMALANSEITVTEAGFGAELGAEKFFDIKCRLTGFSPFATVLVVSVRSLKYNGGVAKDKVNEEDIASLTKGFANAKRHIENIKSFGQTPIVAVNRFPHDTKQELDTVVKLCCDLGVKAFITSCFAEGGSGAIPLAEELLKLSKEESKPLQLPYEDEDSVLDKITAVATKIYRAKSVTLSEKAKQSLSLIEKVQEYRSFPICIAKTQYSFSADLTLLGAPCDFDFEVQDVEVRGGARMLVVIGGKMLLMPGLSKSPNTDRITFNAETGEIDGLM